MIKEVLLVQLKIIYKNTLFIVFSSLEKKLDVILQSV